MGRWSWGWESRLESASSWNITPEWAPRKWRSNNSSFPIVTRLWWHGILAISVTSLARYVCPFLHYLGGYIYIISGLTGLTETWACWFWTMVLSIVPCEGIEKKQKMKATWTLKTITGSRCNMSCELVFGWRHAGSICELPGYIDEHHRRSGFFQRGKRSSPPTQHFSLQILLHLHTQWHPRTTEASNRLSGTAIRIRRCNSRSCCLRSPLHATQFLELESGDLGTFLWPNFLCISFRSSSFLAPSRKNSPKKNETQ